MAEVFKAESLGREEVAAGYTNALRSIDQQRLETHVRRVMSPSDKGIEDQMKRLDAQYARVKVNYEAWIALNPEDTSKKVVDAEDLDLTLGAEDVPSGNGVLSPHAGLCAVEE